MRPAALALALLVAPAATRAEPASLSAGRRAYEEGDFDRALAETLASLDARDASRADLRDAHGLLAVLRLVLGDAVAARRHADAALALDHGATPPPGAPPAASPLFADAAVARRPFSLAVSAEGARDVRALRVAVGPTPEALALRLSVRCVDVAGATRLDVTTAPSGARFPLPSPAVGSPLACEASLVTAAGLRVHTARAAVAAPDAAAPARWPLALGLGVAGAVLVGVVVGVVLSSSPSAEGPRFEGPRWPGP